MQTTPLIDRDDPARLLPVDLPREFRAFAAEPVTVLGAGAAGKVGLLELEFAVAHGKTRMVHHYYRSPLQFFQPMYYDPARPDMPTIIFLQNGGGMLQGDRYRIDIACREGAAAHVTTQSAGKLYKCEENYISQIVEITADADSFIEYLPDYTIPYRHSRFFQRTSLHLHPTATAIIGEVLTPGRTAHGEYHEYDIYLAQMDAFAPDGRLLVADTVKLQPTRYTPRNPALLGRFDAYGVLYVFTRRMPAAELTGLLRTALTNVPRTMSGVSALPNDAGVAVRTLGDTGTVVERARTIAWQVARQALFGVPAPDLRKA
jgi:urease accessory protein